VEVEAIVDVDGSVRPVRVTKSLDEDLDIQALDAVKQWKSQPALVDGTAEPCRVRIELTFVLRPS
jgi:TonB family protein